MAVIDPDLAPDVRHLACIGLMGSGKSTVGRLVAERLGWGFVDVDEIIEDSTGCTVAELWEHGGEEAYRPLEQSIVIDCLGAFDHSVLATPGGVVLDREAVSAIEAQDVVAVYLRAGPDVLADRIAHDAGHTRPLIDDHPGEVMRAMFEARDGSYQALADQVVEVDDLTPDQAASAVLHLLVGEVLRPGVEPEGPAGSPADLH
ncbi:MAG TPA: shikimate kinase [Acidimicrobiales bacterium]|nr:shikimate kinase [Acidimicrobiales bacterium]